MRERVGHSTRILELFRTPTLKLVKRVNYLDPMLLFTKFPHTKATKRSVFELLTEATLDFKILSYVAKLAARRKLDMRPLIRNPLLTLEIYELFEPHIWESKWCYELCRSPIIHLELLRSIIRKFPQQDCFDELCQNLFVTVELVAEFDVNCYSWHIFTNPNISVQLVHMLATRSTTQKGMGLLKYNPFTTLDIWLAAEQYKNMQKDVYFDEYIHDRELGQHLLEAGLTIMVPRDWKYYAFCLPDTPVLSPENVALTSRRIRRQLVFFMWIRPLPKRLWLYLLSFYFAAK